MAKKTLSREAKRMAAAEPKPSPGTAKVPLARKSAKVTEKAPKPPLETAKASLVSAAEKVVDVVAQAADAAQEHVLKPVPESLEIVKKSKKARFVREKKEKTPQAKATSLPARSTRTVAKMMTKNLKHAPTEKPGSSPKRHSG